MVDDVVRREAHAEESAGGVQVARHARARVHVLPETLKDTHIIYIYTHNRWNRFKGYLTGKTACSCVHVLPETCLLYTSPSPRD